MGSQLCRIANMRDQNKHAGHKYAVIEIFGIFYRKNAKMRDEVYHEKRIRKVFYISRENSGANCRVTRNLSSVANILPFCPLNSDFMLFLQIACHSNQYQP